LFLIPGFMYIRFYFCHPKLPEKHYIYSMKRSILISGFLCLLGAAAYGQVPGMSPVAGNESDTHGCDGTAGFVYSSLRKECIRPSDQRIQLIQADTSGSFIMGGAIIFSDDGKKAEVFIPGPRKSLLLSNQGNGTWKKGAYLLSKPEKYLLQENGTAIYREK